MRDHTILLGHGSGGRLSHELIRDVFYRYFENPVLKLQSDSAIVQSGSRNIAFTTDSYVVDPVFFNGGDIGRLAVCGTVNDLAVSGGVPAYISAAFIIEEGFPLHDLETIVSSMAEEAVKAGVIIVAGDTKVVSRGQCDKIFITTAGIGFVDERYKEINTGKSIKPGNKVLINGTIADHGMTIMAARNFGNFHTDISSDCAPLNHLIKELFDAGCRISFMRDATRGGLATIACELAEQYHVGIEIDEQKVPLNEKVKGICELLGFDPFYVANEGKVVVVVHEEDAAKALSVMRKNEYGKKAEVIGEVVDNHCGKAILKTAIGGKRIIDMLAGEQLPRIC